MFWKQNLDIICFKTDSPDVTDQTQSIVSYSQIVRPIGLAVSHHHRVQNSISANLVDWSQVGRACS